MTYTRSLDNPDNVVYQNNDILILSCFLKAMEIVEEVFKAEQSEEKEEAKITRIEVIDSKGRSYVNWDDKNKVELSYQDNNRTLKIFISKPIEDNKQ